MARDATRLDVLLVEDDEDDAELLLRELEAGGFAPHHERVDSREQMQSALARRSWDVILADWRIPQFGAMAAFELLREQGLVTPFLIVSGSIGEDAAVEALRAGASDFILKDRLTRLVPAIHRELREADARREGLRVEQRLAAIVESTADAVLATDPHGTITDWNPAAERVLGHAAAEAIGRPLAWLFPEDRHAEIESIQRELALGQGVRGFETIARCKNGNEVDVAVTLSLIRIEGTSIGMSAIVRDQSETKQMRMRLAVSDRMASIGTIAAGIAHEINNPLAYVEVNVSLAIEQLAARELSPAQLAELGAALEQARQGIDRIRATVKDVRTFARGDDDALVPVDVNGVIGSALNMAWSEIRYRARFTKELGALRPVLATESRLGQVFLNLLVNAAQAIEPGHPEDNAIRVRTFAEGERVITAISDTGQGIAPQHMRRLFTPFFTTKPAGQGTGLGLSVCHDIVVALGGRIDVESEPGRGTTFRVELPAAPGTEPATTRDRGRILVIDDEPLVGTALRRLLGREHDITALTDAEQALRLLARGEEFDVVLCDVVMPGMGGVQFHDELERRYPAVARRLVFMAGGYSHQAATILATRSNARLDKPFDIALLRATIARFLK